MTSPRILMSAWQMRAKKKLGQHFLKDPALAQRIVAASRLEEKDVVLEIGAGLGALTLPAAKAVKQLYAIDLDPDMLKLLRAEVLAAGLDNVEFIQANILRFDWAGPAKKAGQKIVVLGNLPYNISSQILVRLIDNRKRVKRAVLMFQKDLAERLAARPGGKQYGRLTVMLAYCATVKPLFRIEAERFFPRPKVESEVLEITFRKSMPLTANNEKFLFQVVKAAFGRRRKTLKNALAGSTLNLDARTARTALQCAGIDPVRRAETLSVEEFVRLSNQLKST